MTFGGVIFGPTLLLAAQAPDYVTSGSFLTFHASPAFSESYVSVDVGRLKGEDSEPAYWFMWRERDKSSGEVRKSRWTDTQNCDAASSVLTSLHGVSPPRVSIPGYEVSPGGGIRIMGDGVHYEISVRAHYSGTEGSDLSFSSNVGTPLAEWIEGSLEVLEPCWSSEAPAALAEKEFSLNL
ncbi:hypothetical protein [Erythrobacter aurantius]|uniref:hypothetical protein n=1 Tax=Erythrobacter aurantius TaxID=2909249 RepID=UPI002079D1B6|nr:hypothetical protein [Erythrobacter aurantius]